MHLLNNSDSTDNSIDTYKNSKSSHLASLYFSKYYVNVDSSSQHQNDIFYKKYYKYSIENKDYFNLYRKYKKKYIELKSKLNNEQVGGDLDKKSLIFQNDPEEGIDFDIYIAGQTNPTNLFQKAFIKMHNGQYYISINLPLHNMGPVSYPIVLQDKKVYSTDTVNGNQVIRFKYKDGNNIKVIEFKYNAFLRKRFSLKRGNEILNIM